MFVKRPAVSNKIHFQDEIIFNNVYLNPDMIDTDTLPCVLTRYLTERHVTLPEHIMNVRDYTAI